MSDTEQRTEEAVEVTVNGKVVAARPNELLIDAAERHGIYIPRFCYHPRMRPVGMCRMCIVEVDTGRGPALQPSCMLPVTPGMTVETESDVTKKAQDGVLEFLLINHPLDCPVCDKGGECPLQDQTLTFGPGESRFVEEKRHFEKPIPISDLVYLDRERCILCDRCTRFAREVAGDPLISFIERGNATQVNTFPDDPFASYFSGNTVQICPVGALTAKPYRFRARPWDLEQVESTCTSCSFGCRVAVQSSTNRVVRLLGVDVDPVNWGWMCDKGRFDFEAWNGDERLGAPLLRGEGDEQREASWSDALRTATEALVSARDRHGPGSVAVLGGARLTNEDAYAWAKLAKGVIGTDNVDAQLGDGLPAEAVVGLPRATIDEACGAEVVVLLGPDLKEEVPVLYLRLRDAAVERGLQIVELSPHATGLTRYATASLRYRPGEAHELVRRLAGGEGLDETETRVAELLGSERVVCVLGRPSLAERPHAVAEAAWRLAELVPGVTFLSSLRRANVHGAIDMGLAPGVLPGRVTLDEGRDWFAGSWPVVPAERGLDATGILSAAAEGRIQALVLLGADPLADFPDRDLARRALAGAGFVLAVDCFATPSVRQADVVLPATGYAEKRGTTTNIEGRISRLEQKVTGPGTARADWMIAAELAFRLGGDLGFDTLGELWSEVERLAPSHAGITTALINSPRGLDGIVAPLSQDQGGAARPRAQTEAPEVAAASTQMGVDTVNITTSGAPAEPAAIADSPTTTGSEALTESQQLGATPVQPGETPEEVVEEAVGKAVEAAADPAEEVFDEAGEGPALEDTSPARPPLLRFSTSGAVVPPAVDSYSLRLVAGRKLYDHGTLVQQSPSLAHLAGGTAVRVNQTDLDRLGLASGSRVRVSSARGALVLEAVADPGVPRGTAVVVFNQPGSGAADLIDASAEVTDVRVETVTTIPVNGGDRGTADETEGGVRGR